MIPSKSVEKIESCVHTLSLNVTQKHFQTVFKNGNYIIQVLFNKLIVTVLLMTLNGRYLMTHQKATILRF